MAKMTEKQKRFCEEYLIDCNAKQAAIRAGYSVKTAHSIGNENLNKPELKKYITEKLEEVRSRKTADAQEVMEYLSSVLRGEQKEQQLRLAGDGSQIIVEMAASVKDRLKAAELLGKRFGIFKENVSVTGALPVVIGGEDELED